MTKDGTGRFRARMLEHMGILIAYFSLALVVTYPVVLTARHAIAMDPQIPGWVAGDGDPWHYLWGFWYVRKALVTFPPPLLWTDLVFFPIGFDLPFLPGFGLILVPAALLTSVVGLALTYNLLWWISFSLAGYSMYLLVRHLARDRIVAFVCGGLFTFSSYRLIHSVEHLPILMASFLVPLFALALLRATRKPTIPRCAVPALVLAASTGISWYATVTLLLYLGIALAVTWWEHGLAAPTSACVVSILVGLVVFAAAAAPFVLPLMLSSGRDSIVDRPLVESIEYSADLLAYFVPSPRNPLLGGLTEGLYRRFSGNAYEQTVYLGYVLLALSVGGVLTARRATTRLFRMSALVALVLALGPYLHVAGKFRFAVGGEVVRIPLPFLLMRHVPFVRGARVSSRFTELLLMALVVLAGYGLARACARRATLGKTGIAALVLLAALLETTIAPFPLASARVPAVYAEIGRAPEAGTVLELPLDGTIIKYHYYQTVHGKRMLVGNPVRPRAKYADYPMGISPIQYLRDPRLLLDGSDPPDARRDAARLADFFDIRYVVLHGEYLAPRAFERLDRFVADNFPHAWRRSEGTVVAYGLRRGDPIPHLWPDRYFVDFGEPPREFALLTGWSRNERWGEGGPTMQWTTEGESSVVVALGAPADRVLEARMHPFLYPGSPKQTVTIAVNGTPRTTLVLQAAWTVYRVPLPATWFRAGLNTLTFRYGYVAVPATVVPGSSDLRTLAVAFDYLALSPDR